MDTYAIPGLAQALFAESGDALFLFDPDSDQLLDVNPVAERLCAFSRDELLSMRATYLFRFEGQGGKQRLQRAAQQTGIFHSQDGFLLRTQNEGVWVPVNLTINRLHVKPKTLGLITARDMREQRDAHTRLQTIEAELRRVMASVSDCLWSAEIDQAGRWTYRYFSPVVEKITSQPPNYFLAGLKQWRNVVHPDDRPRWEKAMARLRSVKSHQEEYRVVWPDGSTRWVRDSVQVSAGADGALRLDGVLTDITERKRAEAAMLQSEKLASLGQLAAGVAHEINNPLAYVTNNVAVLRRDVLGAMRLLAKYREARETLQQTQPELAAELAGIEEEIHLGYIRENVVRLFDKSHEGLKRVRDIVKNLSDFARLDEAEFKEIDVNAALESTAEIIAHEVKSKSIQLTTAYQPCPLIWCHPGKINQVFLNLLINAVQACATGGVIQIRTASEADQGVIVEIDDNGCGIRAEHMPHIFEPFFTTKPVGQGTGLGLSVSYGIIRDHGGKIEAESVPGEGSTFRVRLPVKPPGGGL